MSLPSNRFSDKRYKVLEAIDLFGAITMFQLQNYLGDSVPETTIRRARKQGQSLDYIRERYYGKRKLIAITEQGAQFIGRNMKGVSLTNDDMFHQLISNEILLKYLHQYQDRGHEVTFLTERDILRETQFSLSYAELKKPNKIKNLAKDIPDFILHIGEKTLAFEIEISRKTNRRIENKLRKYKASTDYDRIFYVCGNDSIRKAVESISDYLNAGISFLMLNEVIDVEEV